MRSTLDLSSSRSALKPRVSAVFFEEVLAAPGHATAASAFGLGRALEAKTLAGRWAAPLLWVSRETISLETGELYGAGLQAFGCPPERVVLACLRRDIDVLRAALEGARCGALGALIIETTTPIDLTASRRFKLAAEASGVAIVLIRHRQSRIDAEPLLGQGPPNAVRVRWHVRNAVRTRDPPRPVFDVELLKHPNGTSERRFLMEWDRDRHAFARHLAEIQSHTEDAVGDSCGRSRRQSSTGSSSGGATALSSTLAAIPACRSLAA